MTFKVFYVMLSSQPLPHPPCVGLAFTLNGPGDVVVDPLADESPDVGAQCSALLLCCVDEGVDMSLNVDAACPM